MDQKETANPQLGLNALLRGGQCELPPSVATCPECGGKLEVDCNEWDSKTGIPTESGFDVSCISEEEDLDTWMYNDDDERDMREVAHRHWQSDWQPVIDTVWKWIESQRPST